MVIFTNKYAELLNIDENKSKIEILRNFNDMAYEVKIDDKTMKKIDFISPKNKDKEYPIMVVLPNEYKRYMFVGTDKNRMKWRTTIIQAFILAKEKPYPIRKKYIKMWFRVLWNNISLYFRKLWWCGVLNRRNIYKERITMEKDYPNFMSDYEIMKSSNDTFKVMSKFMDKYRNYEGNNNKAFRIKAAREIIEYANTISVRNMK